MLALTIVPCLTLRLSTSTAKIWTVYPAAESLYLSHLEGHHWAALEMKNIQDKKSIRKMSDAGHVATAMIQQ